MFEQESPPRKNRTRHTTRSVNWGTPVLAGEYPVLARGYLSSGQGCTQCWLGRYPSPDQGVPLSWGTPPGQV